MSEPKVCDRREIISPDSNTWTQMLTFLLASTKSSSQWYTENQWLAYYSISFTLQSHLNCNHITLDPEFCPPANRKWKPTPSCWQSSFIFAQTLIYNSTQKVWYRCSRNLKARTNSSMRLQTLTAARKFSPIMTISAGSVGKVPFSTVLPGGINFHGLLTAGSY